MNDKQKESTNIAIMAQAYSEFIDVLNKLEKLDKHRVYTISEIKFEMAKAFELATLSYLGFIRNRKSNK